MFLFLLWTRRILVGHKACDVITHNLKAVGFRRFSPCLCTIGTEIIQIVFDISDYLAGDRTYLCKFDRNKTFVSSKKAWCT